MAIIGRYVIPLKCTVFSTARDRLLEWSALLFHPYRNAKQVYLPTGLHCEHSIHLIYHHMVFTGALWGWQTILSEMKVQLLPYETERQIRPQSLSPFLCPFSLYPDWPTGFCVLSSHASPHLWKFTILLWCETLLVGKTPNLLKRVMSHLRILNRELNWRKKKIQKFQSDICWF